MAGENNDDFINSLEEEPEVKAYDSRLMKRLLKYASKYWHYFLFAVFLLFASTVADLARPYLIGITIDNFIKNGDTRSLNRMGLIFLALVAAGFLFNLLQIYVLSYAGQSIIYNIRQQLFSHLQKMPLLYFDRNPVGRIVTRVTNDTETLNDMYTNALVTLLKDFAIIAGTIAIMFRLNIAMSLAALSVMPVVVALTVFFRIRIRKVYRNVRIALARINSAIAENISGMRIIQIFNREDTNFEKFDRTGQEYKKAVMSEVVTFGLFRPLIEMLASITLALLIWFGGIRVLDGTLRFGILYAFVNYIGMLFQPINDFAEKYNILQSSMAASERIFLILDTPAEEDEGKYAINGNMLVCDATEAGVPDTGAADTGMGAAGADAGVTDMGTADASAVDTGAAGAGASDADAAGIDAVSADTCAAKAGAAGTDTAYHPGLGTEVTASGAPIPGLPIAGVIASGIPASGAHVPGSLGAGTHNADTLEPGINPRQACTGAVIRSPGGHVPTAAGRDFPDKGMHIAEIPGKRMLKGGIEFKNVWFAYNGNDWVLRDVSFRVPSGKTVAIVGATGAGKTSIISLLSRLYEIQKGEILIDGINIKDIRKDSLRRFIGVVLQDVFLFSGKLKDNIRLNEEGISDEKIKEVAKYVNADNFISKLPLGYDSEVAERGSTFSAGQRQLLAFARALAFDPAVLVLDEATSNIDTETELLIQDALAKLTKNRTTIIIAHRLSTIQHADNIIVLHKGRVRESGNHQELLSKRGIYYSLYLLQYRNGGQP